MARHGGASYLIPIALDNYLFDRDGWESENAELATAVRARVCLDFQAALANDDEYERALDRLINVLKKLPASDPPN